MLHLIGGIYEQFFGEARCNLLIVGADGAGKSTLVEHLKLMMHPTNPSHRPNPDALRKKQLRPTVGLNMVRLHRHTGNVNIALWDLGGQANLRPLWSNYYPQCHGVIFVVDVSTLASRQADVAYITRHLVSRPDLKTAPMAILFNKWDMLANVTDASVLPGGSDNGEPDNGATPMSLAKGMDALALTDALLHASGVLFSTNESKNDASCSIAGGRHRSGGGAPSYVGAASSSGAAGGIPLPPEAGSCGFGSKVLRCFKVSSLTGEGVMEAMEWILQQSMHAAREVLEDDR